ncbi:hypothetical protein I6G46_15675 [Serratia plymuthica]|uniref:DNA methyltransferase n=1 Tax=Serratia plymuthica TaxID=82996 RepID=UPI0018D72871|nr:DNA methyltransferase [Serratia plymuthica]QPS85632.1 hypothetical protein I6G46_15675 [Serratia plymuthica]
MNLAKKNSLVLPSEKSSALECSFPAKEISQVAEHESWRKEINRPIYHIHKWWATRLGSVFRAIALSALSKPNVDIWKEFYNTHNFHDKIILDPFMGSGTTLGESIKLGSKAIGCDINPISTFLVKQAFTRVSEDELRSAYKALESSVADDIKSYYKTISPLTGEYIPVSHYFWVKIVTLPDGEDIPLFSKYIFSQDAYPKKKPKAQILCPNCWHVMEDRYDCSGLSCNKCKHFFNPQNGPVSGQFVTSKSGRKYKIKDLVSASGDLLKEKIYASLALTDSGEKIYLPITADDIRIYKKAESRLLKEKLPLPDMRVRSGHNTDQALGYNYRNWSDFFNSRQLLCLGLLLKNILKIKNEDIQEQLLCLFSGTLEFNNLFCSYKGEGTGAVRHMFSNHTLKPERTPLENCIWGAKRSSGTFSTLFESRLIKAKNYLNEPFEIKVEYNIDSDKTSSSKFIASKPIQPAIVNDWDEFKKTPNSMMVLNGNSSNLNIPSNSIDAVITDPPYFDFVHYSELSDFFFAWLAPVLNKRYSWFKKENSYDKGEVQQKDPELFAKQLASVFKESHRVLKKDGTLTFSFHHSKPEGWAAIYEAITNAGFTIVAVHPVHAESRSASPKTIAKSPISLDAILVCKKSISHVEESPSSEHTDMNKISKSLEDSGMKLSLGDLFVIGASIVLMSESLRKISYEKIKEKLDKVYQEINNTKENLIID